MAQELAVLRSRLILHHLRFALTQPSKSLEHEGARGSAAHASRSDALLPLGACKWVRAAPPRITLARRDYLAGFTASAVSQRYGMSVDAIRKCASKQGWCKAHHLKAEPPPEPLHPLPDAAEAVRFFDLPPRRSGLSAGFR